MSDLAFEQKMASEDLAAPGRARQLCVSRQYAAEEMLSTSLSTFERYVQPHLRLVRIGRSRLVPVQEVERWVEANAERVQ